MTSLPNTVEQWEQHLATLLKQLSQALMQRGWHMATAESCTGGLMASVCTSQAGASQWFDSAVVSYSYEAKAQLLGVPMDIITRDGAVSEAVVRAMAEGLLMRTNAHLAIAVSGIAGPDGGTPDKPVGTVWIAWAVSGQATTAQRFQFDGSRTHVRWQTCEQGLHGALARASQQPA